MGLNPNNVAYYVDNCVIAFVPLWTFTVLFVRVWYSIKKLRESNKTDSSIQEGSTAVNQRKNGILFCRIIRWPFTAGISNLFAPKSQISFRELHSVSFSAHIVSTRHYIGILYRTLYVSISVFWWAELSSVVECLRQAEKKANKSIKVNSQTVYAGHKRTSLNFGIKRLSNRCHGRKATEK